MSLEKKQTKQAKCNYLASNISYRTSPKTMQRPMCFTECYCFKTHKIHQAASATPPTQKKEPPSNKLDGSIRIHGLNSPKQIQRTKLDYHILIKSYKYVQCKHTHTHYHTLALIKQKNAHGPPMREKKTQHSLTKNTKTY